ncbi:MAG TPA: hypothetical protein VGW78_02210 [Candidatus Babeliales bacterium]|nr:hypothetical protein [Candidatus Babeliales bacterium]
MSKHILLFAVLVTSAAMAMEYDSPPRPNQQPYYGSPEQYSQQQNIRLPQTPIAYRYMQRRIVNAHVGRALDFNQDLDYNFPRGSQQQAS